jgi:hypothetical protein
MATKPGDVEKTPLWRKILGGVTTLVVVVSGLAALVSAAVAGWKDGAKDLDEEDELDEDLDDEEEEEEEEEDA